MCISASNKVKFKKKRLSSRNHAFQPTDDCEPTSLESFFIRTERGAEWQCTGPLAHPPARMTSARFPFVPYRLRVAAARRCPPVRPPGQSWPHRHKISQHGSCRSVCRALQGHTRLQQGPCNLDGGIAAKARCISTLNTVEIVSVRVGKRESASLLEGRATMASGL